MPIWAATKGTFEGEPIGPGGGRASEKAVLGQADPPSRLPKELCRCFTLPSFLAAALPALFVLGFVLELGVDLPYWDQWGYIEPIVHWVDGDIRFEDLWRCNNEHRFFFPCIVMYSMASLTDWNVRAELLFIWAFLGVATLLGILRCLSGMYGAARPLAVFAISCLVFSLHAWTNWLWGIQISTALAVSGTVWTCVLLSRRELRTHHVVWATVLATIASYSMLAGFLAWPSGLLILLLRPNASGWRRNCTSAFWIAAAGIAILVHVADAPPVQLPSRPSLARLPEVIEFACIYVGTSIVGSLGRREVAFALGLFAQLLLLVLMQAVLTSRGRPAAWRLGLVAIGVFGLATGYMIAWGRGLDFGPESAMNSRYLSTSVLVWIAIVGLSAELLPTARKPVRWTFHTGTVVLLAALIAHQPPSFHWGVRFHQEISASQKAALTGEGLSGVGVNAFNPEHWLPLLPHWLDTLKMKRLSLYRTAPSATLRLSSEFHDPPCTVELAGKTEAAGGLAHITIVIKGGVPGNLVSLFLVAVDGWPTEHLIDRGALDDQGCRRMTIPVPCSTKPRSVTIRCDMLGHGAQLVSSPNVTLDI